MKYKIENITPENQACGIGACPAIYKGLREITPQDMNCITAFCSSVYEAQRKGKEVYLIIGKVVSPIEAGFERKVGEGEALIEVPKPLIDDLKK